MRARRYSLKSLLIVPFVAQIAATVALVGYFSFQSGRNAVNHLAAQLRSELTERIRGQLQHYMESSFLLNQMNSTALLKGDLSLTETEKVHTLWQQAKIYPSNNLIYCARESDGTFLGVGRSGVDRPHLLMVQYSGPTTNYRIHNRVLTSLGEPVGEPKIYERLYDPRKRPWYIAAKQERQAVWSPIYVDFNDRVPVITASQPIYDPDTKALMGVCATDFLLSVEVDKFLTRILTGRSGETFIIDRAGNLISSSSAMEEQLAIADGDSVRQLPVSASRNTLVRETGQQLQEKFQNLDNIQTEEQFTFQSNGKQFVQVAPFYDARGLDWLIVVVIPEAEFMEEIYRNAYATVALCLAALVIAAVTGIITARRITKPLLKLNQATQKITGGHWEQSIAIDRNDEVGDLARSFQTMILQLQHSFEQQNLLTQELIASKDQLSHILDALPIGVAVLNPDGSGYLNQTGLQLIGTNLDGLTASHGPQAGLVLNIPPQEITNALHLYRAGTNEVYPAEKLPILQALQGVSFSTDDLEVHRNGQVIALETRSIPVRHAEGQILYAISIFQDITARKQAESALREQEAQFRRIAESVPGMIYRYIVHGDGSSHFAYVSPRCRELFEVEPEAAMQDATLLWSTIDPEDAKALQESLQRAMATLHQEPLELRLTTASGQQKWIQSQSCAAAMPNGDFIWDGIAVDITDRKQAAKLLEEYSLSLEEKVYQRTLALEYEIAERRQIEAILLEQEALLTTVLDNIGAHVYIKLVTGEYTYVNQLCAELFGVPKEEVLGSFDDRFFDADTIQRMRKAERHIIQTGEALRMYQVNHLQSGKKFDTLTIKVPLKHEDGTIYAICGISTDITELKQTEAALRQSEAQNRAIVTAIPDLMYFTNTDGIFLGYCRAHQLADLIATDQDPVGQHLTQLLPSEVAHRHMHHLQQACATGEMQTYEQEIWIDGKQQYEEVRVTPAGENRVLFMIRDISDRKRIEAERQHMEAKLQNQQEFLHNVIDVCPYPIFVKDIESRFVILNQAAAQIYARSPGEMLGKKDSEFNHHHEQVEEFWKSNQEVMRTRQQQIFADQEIVDDNGVQRWYQTIIAPFITPEGEVKGIIGTCIDVSDRKRAEVALRQQREFLRTVLDTIPNVISVRDRDGKFLLVNKAASEFLSKPIHELIGHSDEAHFPPEMWQQFLQETRQVMESQQELFVAEEYFVHPTTRLPCWFQWQKRLLQLPDNDTVGVLGVGIDITQRKQAETALQQAKEAAENANRAKSTFLSSMSHELRTPLNAILGFAQIMRRDPAMNAEQRRNLEIINRSGEHLLELINSVLDLSKIEAGRVELAESTIDLPMLIQTVAAMLHERATSKGLTLSVEVDESVPQTVISDPGKLRQILINLIGNAIKFTDRGGVTLYVHSRPEDTPLSHLNQHTLHQHKLAFKVADTGTGIAAKDLSRVFEAFEQTSSGRKVTEGTGLGLTLTRKFVHLMRGSINVSSVLDEGTVFTVEIPVKVEDSNHSTLPSDRQVVALAPHQPTYRVLVVDDQAVNRELLIKLLQPIGFSVEQAVDGEQAIQQWQQWQPHLILMDIRMPKMNGLEATQQIRLQETRHQSPPVKIIALSASVLQNDRAIAIQAGCDNFLKKPFRENELLDKMAQHLNLTYSYVVEKLEQVPAQLATSTLTLETLRTLPSTWVQKFQYAITTGDDSYSLQLLRELPQDYSLLVKELQELVQNFQFDRILTLLG